MFACGGVAIFSIHLTIAVVIWSFSHVSIISATASSSDRVGGGNLQEDVRNEVIEASYVADIEAMNYLLTLSFEDEDGDVDEEEIAVLSARLPLLMNRKEPVYGRTAAMVCGLKSDLKYRHKVDADCVDIVARLRARGADVHLVDSNGWNAVSIAASKGYANLSSYLISTGVSADLADTEAGLTPLMKAAMHGFDDVFLSLLHNKQDGTKEGTTKSPKGKNKSSNNNKSIEGEGGAMIASQERTVEKETKRLSALSHEGLTALHYVANLALLHHHPFFLQFTTIAAALSVHQLDSTVDKDGRNVLMYAAINNDMHMVDWLLRRGMDCSLSDAFGVRTIHMSRDEHIVALFSAYQEARAVELKHQLWLQQTQLENDHSNDRIGNEEYEL